MARGLFPPLNNLDSNANIMLRDQFLNGCQVYPVISATEVDLSPQYLEATQIMPKMYFQKDHNLYCHYAQVLIQQLS